MKDRAGVESESLRVESTLSHRVTLRRRTPWWCWASDVLGRGQFRVEWKSLHLRPGLPDRTRHVDGRAPQERWCRKECAVVLSGRRKDAGVMCHARDLRVGGEHRGRGITLRTVSDSQAVYASLAHSCLGEGTVLVDGQKSTCTDREPSEDHSRAVYFVTHSRGPRVD